MWYPTVLTDLSYSSSWWAVVHGPRDCRWLPPEFGLVEHHPKLCRCSWTDDGNKNSHRNWSVDVQSGLRYSLEMKMNWRSDPSPPAAFLILSDLKRETERVIVFISKCHRVFCMSRSSWQYWISVTTDQVALRNFDNKPTTNSPWDSNYALSSTYSIHNGIVRKTKNNNEMNAPPYGAVLVVPRTNKGSEKHDGRLVG